MVFRVNDFGPHAAGQEPDGSFSNAVGRGVDQTQLMLYAFANAVGEATGLDTLAEFGEDGVARNMREIQENPAKVQAWDDVHGLADFATYVTERIGEQVPVLASVGLGGGAGVLARAAIGKTLAKQVGQKALARFTAQRAGQLGVIGTSTALNAGETQAQFQQEGVDKPIQALFTGAIKGSLDAAGLFGVMRGAKLASGATLEQALGQGALQLAKATGIESATEASQALVDRISLKIATDGEVDVFSEEGRREIIESAIVGGLLGGVINAPISATEIYKQQAGRKRSEGLIDPTDSSNPLDAFSRAPDPEPQSSLDAQARAVQDPISSRNSVLVTEGGPRPTPGILPDTTEEVQTDFGAVLTTDNRIAERLRTTPPRTEQEIGELLFGAGTRPRAETDGTVLEVTDRSGAVVSEIASTKANEQQLSIDVRNAFDQAPDGGNVRATTVLDALNQRESQRRQEAGQLAELTQAQQFQQATPRLDPAFEPLAAVTQTDTTSDALALPNLNLEDIQGGLQQETDNVVKRAVASLPPELSDAVREGVFKPAPTPQERNTLTSAVNRQISANRDVDDLERSRTPVREQNDMAFEDIQALATSDESNIVNEAINSFGPAAAQIYDVIENPSQLDPENRPAELEELRGILNKKIRDLRSGQQASEQGQGLGEPNDPDSLQQRFTETGEDIGTWIPSAASNQPAKGFSSPRAAARFANKNIPTDTKVRIVGRQAGTESGTERFYLEELGPVVDEPVRGQESVAVSERDTAGKFSRLERSTVEQTPEAFAKQRAKDAADWAIARDNLPENLRTRARELPKDQVGPKNTLMRAAHMLEQGAVIKLRPPGRKTEEEYDTATLTKAGSDLLNARGVSSELSSKEWLLNSLTAMLGELVNQGYVLEGDAVTDGQLNRNLVLSIPSLQNGQNLPFTVKDALNKKKQRPQITGLTGRSLEWLTEQDAALGALAADPPVVPEDIFQSEPHEIQAILDELQAVEVTEFEAKPELFFKTDENGKLITDKDGNLIELGSGARAVALEVGAMIDELENNYAYLEQLERAKSDPDAERSQQIREQEASELRQQLTQPKRQILSRKQKRVKKLLTHEKALTIVKPSIRALALRNNEVVTTSNIKGYGDIKQSEVNFAQDMLDELKFSERLAVDIVSTNRLNTPGEILAFAQAGFFTTAQAEQAIAEFKANKSLRGMVIANGQRATVLVPPLKNVADTAGAIADRMTVIAHEMGHLVLTSVRPSLTPKQRQYFDTAFEADKELYMGKYDNNAGLAKKEWFADKVAARALHMNAPAKGFLDRLVKTVAQSIQAIWKKLAKATNTPRFAQSEAVSNAITRMRDNKFFETLEEFTPETTIERMAEIEKTAKEIGVKVPTFVQMAKAARKLYDISIVHPIAQFFLTNNGALVEIAPEIAGLIQKRVGKQTDEVSITEAILHQTRRWRVALREKTADVFGNVAMPRDRMTKAMDEATLQLARELPDSDLSPLALSLRDYLKELHVYLKEASPIMGYVENYFPRVYDPFQMAAKQADVIDVFKRYEVKDPDGTYLTLLGEAENLDSITDGLLPKKLSWQRERQLTNPDMIRELVDLGVLNSNPAGTLQSYIDQSVRRAEAERKFSDYVEVSRDEAFESASQLFNGTYAEARDQAIKQGYLQVHNKRFFWYDPNGRLDMLLAAVPKEQRGRAKELALQSITPRHSYTLGKSLREWGLEHRTSLGPPSIKKKARRIAARIASKEDRTVVRAQVERSLALRNDPEVASLLIKGGRHILVGTERALVKAWRKQHEPRIKTEVRQIMTAIRDGIRLQKNGSVVPFDQNEQENINRAQAQLSRPLPTTSPTYNVIRRTRMYESFRLLAYSGIASIPEIGVAVQRARGEPVIRETLKQVLKFGSWADAREFAETFGLIQHELGHALATETYQAHHGTRTKPEQALRQFFKWNGNDAVVNFSRITAGIMGKHYFLSLARKLEANPTDKRSLRLLKESRIDVDTIRRWHANGELSPEAATTPEMRDDAEKIAFAIGQFADESTLIPTDSDRPTSSTHPIGALIWHMKTFMVTMHRRVIMGTVNETISVYKETDRSTVSGLNQTSLTLLSMYWPFALVALALGAVSEELRRLIQRGETSDAEWIVKNPVAYAEKAFDRSGVLATPFQEFMSDPSWNNLMYSAGPTASHANELIKALMTEPSTNAKKQADDLRALLRSIPGMSQLPGFRAMVYDTVGSAEAEKILTDTSISKAF